MLVYIYILHIDLYADIQIVRQFLTSTYLHRSRASCSAGSPPPLGNLQVTIAYDHQVAGAKPETPTAQSSERPWVGVRGGDPGGVTYACGRPRGIHHQQEN